MTVSTLSDAGLSGRADLSNSVGGVGRNDAWEPDHVPYHVPSPQRRKWTPHFPWTGRKVQRSRNVPRESPQVITLFLTALFSKYSIFFLIHHQLVTASWSASSISKSCLQPQSHPIPSASPCSTFCRLRNSTNLFPHICCQSLFFNVTIFLISLQRILASIFVGPHL